MIVQVLAVVGYPQSTCCSGGVYYLWVLISRQMTVTVDIADIRVTADGETCYYPNNCVPNDTNSPVNALVYIPWILNASTPTFWLDREYESSMWNLYSYIGASCVMFVNYKTTHVCAINQWKHGCLWNPNITNLSGKYGF